MLPPEGISVSEFIAVFNQTIDYAYPTVAIVGELANFRVSKNKWLYFDLKDEFSSIKFFGTVYQINKPLEEGMLLKVNCSPKLHNNYGFSMQVQSIELIGEGSLKRAAEMVQQKLAAEGLFDESRKRSIAYPPSKIGLITSAQSAAYADFIKILDARWQGIEINLVDVQVQGEPSVEQIISAIDLLNESNNDLEVIVIIRGGGSPEDLAAFSDERLTRAVAASKIPTLVAIGHEIDVSLAELVSDKRASTPSNAAELLVPDRNTVLSNLSNIRLQLQRASTESIIFAQNQLTLKRNLLDNKASQIIEEKLDYLENKRSLLEAYNPMSVLERGFSIVRKEGRVINSADSLKLDDILNITMASGEVSTTVKDIRLKNR